MSGAGRPGPPRLPPGDLVRRPLPLVPVAAGTTLFRIHRTGLGALHFGREADAAARQRWDAPDAGYGVCYLATAGHVAFAETLLRDLAIEAIPEDELRRRSLAEIETARPLRLVNLANEGLRRLRATASVVHGSYDVTWAWSAALHAHPDAPDGIRYRARHDDADFAVALFDRAADAVRERGTRELLSAEVLPLLGGWLDRYDMGIGS